MAPTTTPRPERIDAGWLLAGVGAVLLLVSLFLDWFEPGISAWTVFEALDLVLAATALVTLAYAARPFGLPLKIGRGAAFAAAATALVVVASQLIDRPPAALDLDIETGAWLALAGAALMLLGAILSRTGMSLSVVVERDAAGTPAGDPRPGPAAPKGAAAPPPPTSPPGVPRAPDETVPLRPDDPRA